MPIARVCETTDALCPLESNARVVAVAQMIGTGSRILRAEVWNPRKALGRGPERRTFLNRLRVLLYSSVNVSLPILMEEIMMLARVLTTSDVRTFLFRVLLEAVGNE